MKRAILILLIVVAASASALVLQSTPPPIRIWGPPAMRGIAERWTEAYRSRHPDANFEIVMKGSGTAIPGLYGGQADIALMGRTNDIVDDNGFTRTMERNFTRIEVASGSVSTPGKSDAIAILVSSSNPLKRLTLDQLDSTVNCGRSNVARTWGELGLTGAWADKPVKIYGYDMASRTGLYFQQVVTRKGRRMCWDRVAEFADARRLDGTHVDASDRVGEAAARDPFALAIANPAQTRHGLKLVAIGAGDDAALPTEAEIVARRYPLARRAYAFVDRKPGSPLDPRIADFLQFVLSAEGQALLAADRGYLPLDRANAVAQARILGESD